MLPGVDNATIVQRMLTAINTFPLLAVIFFVFARTLLAPAGIARRLVNMAAALAGTFPAAPLFPPRAIPGVMFALSLVVASFFHGRRHHQKALPTLTRREKIWRIVNGMAGVFTMVIILGGFITAFFPATGAGAL